MSLSSSDFISWSKKEFSHLPWRRERTLYRTLVSEIMLQQTTVSTVLARFESFMEKFPKISDLAKSSEEEIISAWAGLGYYRRAKNLRKAAIIIEEKFKGNIPQTYEELTSIQGIGDYTASALLGIGFNQKRLAIDANVNRVLSRIHRFNSTRELRSRFPPGSLGGREYNEALMDVGRVFCQKRRTDCTLCPLQKVCLSYGKTDVLDFPMDVVKKNQKFELDLLRIVVRREGEIFVVKRPKGSWLEGQYEVPTFILKSKDKELEQYPPSPFVIEKEAILNKFKSSITKYKITNHVMELSDIQLEGE